MKTFTSFLVMSAILFGCQTVQKPVIESNGLSRWGNSPLVKISSGWIQGREEDSCFSFKGIPYASPPVKHLRWKAPRPHPGWEGIYYANTFRGTSPQFLPFLGWVIGDEDMLYLNIWRPKGGETNLPVYVWIHGGGNSIGSAHYVPDYYGAHLAKKGNLVFVSLNYRLGPFGWLSHPLLQDQTNDQDDSGNYGTLDIIAALTWIQSNIIAFGGDPSRVTIAGESAGGLNVLSLLISPQAKGLFHRAVIQSGYTAILSREEAYAYATSLFARILVKKRQVQSLEEAKHMLTSFPRESIRRVLYNTSAKEILSCLQGGRLGMTGEAHLIADGRVLPREGFAALEKGNFSPVPVIIGNNKEETKLFLSFSRKDWESPTYQALGLLGGMRWKALYVDAIADILSQHHIPVYVYRFDWGSPDTNGYSPLGPKEGKRLGAFHTLEIPFWLGNTTIQGFFLTGRVFTPSNEKGRKALSSAMQAYLIAFVHTGSPTPETPLPPWPQWKEKQEKLGLFFDATETELRLSYQTFPFTLSLIEEYIERVFPPSERQHIRQSLGLTNSPSSTSSP
ncbi:MAG: carboxylesterase family protein [Brevinematales bacterium]|nr:carboxylesterase family protein [Brevinematales bacterium]